MITALEGGERSASRPGRSLPSGKDPVPIAQEAGWVPGPVSTGAENLSPTGIRSPDRPARSQSLYRLRYPAHSRAIHASKTALGRQNATTGSTQPIRFRVECLLLLGSRSPLHFLVTRPNQQRQSQELVTSRRPPHAIR